MSFTITQAVARNDLDGVAAMTRRYLAWDIAAFKAASGISLSAEDYAANTLDHLEEYMPPNGRVLMARDADGSLLGLVMLRQLTAQAGEVKRLYIDETARGRGIARQLIERLLNEARGIGYRHLFLDTATYMQAAHHLYRSVGFRDCDPYPGGENDATLRPYLIFMSLDLGASETA